DGDLTSQITVSGAVYTGQAGTYTLTYQVADAAGHVATKTRTVQVVDLGAPLITLNGPNPMEIEAGSAFTDPGATAHDAIDGDLTSQITVSGAVYANQTGTYTLVYRVRDSSGNAAADVTRTVNVIPQEASSGSSGSSSAERSSNADIALLMLDLEGKTLGLTPVFAPEITHYTAETDAGQVRLRVTLADPGAIVTWRDQPVEDTKIIPLAMGINEIVLKVRAEDGSVKTYTITITRHTVKLTPPSNGGCTFTDIRNHWAEPEICEAAALGIVEGVDAQTFMPDVRVTRTEFAVMLLRTQRIPISNEAVPMPFLDKESIPEWARQAIRTAVAKGVLDGFLDGTLRPQQTVSRAEMAAMLAKSMKWETAGLKDTSFADNASIPAWAKGYVEATRKHGMVEGRDGNQFVPDGRTTRAEAAVVLLRLWKTLH
ncbi:immunoglobulin-like domain-containing protein, partial [Paenibacillus sp. cl123]